MSLIPDDPDDIRRTSEDSARRVAAAISGAIEGFLEALDEFDLADEAKRSAQQAGEVARAAGTEAKAQADTPEMKMVGEKLHGAADATGQAAQQAADRLNTAAQDAKYGAQQTAADVRDRVVAIKEGVTERAEAVAESGRRARIAPGRIARELRAGVSAWWTGLLTALGMWVAIGIFGIVTLVVLTIALVVGLNELLGDPAGTWLVAGIYVVVMLVAYGVARGARRKASEETQRRIENSRAEVRHVTEPVRGAFGRGRAGI